MFKVTSYILKYFIFISVTLGSSGHSLILSKWHFLFKHLKVNSKLVCANKMKFSNEKEKVQLR